VISPFKGMQLGPAVRESQLRNEAPAYLVACGLACGGLADDPD
jgi:type IV pilus assembly protein PilM